MPVEITNPLPPEMQAVADCREHVRNCESEVDECKAKLKLAKSVWETAVTNLNTALDTMLDAERQPRLFDRFARGDDGPTDPPGGAGPVDPPGGPGGGTVEPAGDVADAEYEVNPVSVASLPAPQASRVMAKKTTGVPGWRELHAAEHLDLPEAVFESIAEHGFQTLGDIAEALLRGESMGLGEDELREMKEGIRDVSADDDEPIRFAELEADAEDGDRAEDEEESAEDEKEKPKGKRRKATASKKGA